jgi:prepilin-type N-terminal cleavage/methylation domain-containing protein
MGSQRPTASTAGVGRRAAQPSAYTLIELMIVLAILAGLAAVSWPALMRPWSRSLAQQAAQQFGAELLEARTRAVEESRVYRLRWRPGSGEFEIDAPLIEPLGEAPEMLGREASVSPEAAPSRGDIQSTINSAEPLGGIPDSAFDSTSFRRPAPYHTLDQLANGVRFTGQAGAVRGSTHRDLAGEPRTTSPPFSATTPAESDRQNTTAPATDNSLNWSEPVWFFPDGRTSNGRWTLKSDDAYEVEVVLRGLTGTVRVHPARRVHANDELERLEDEAVDAGEPALQDAALSPPERPAAENRD